MLDYRWSHTPPTYLYLPLVSNPHRSEIRPQKQLNYRCIPLHPAFFLQKIAHHQASNFIKKKLLHKCFTVDFAKLLKALCRTPPVSASNFNSTFLTLRARRTYIYVFPALLFFDISKPLHVPYRG